MTLIMIAYSCENSLIIIKGNSQHKLKQKAILNLSLRIQNTRREEKSLPGTHCRSPFSSAICHCCFSSLCFTYLAEGNEALSTKSAVTVKRRTHLDRQRPSSWWAHWKSQILFSTLGWNSCAIWSKVISDNLSILSCVF